MKCRLTTIGLILSFCAPYMPCVLAQTSTPVLDSPYTKDHVHVSAQRAGDLVLVALRIDPGYHVNANPASNEYLIPTTVAFDDSVAKRIGYPPPIFFQPTFANEPIKVYEGSVVISAIFAPGALNRKDRALGFTVTAQACTKEVCLLPDDIEGRVTW